MYFLTILFVFLCAYGVSVAAILKPQTPSWKMLVDVIFHPYYNIYGELFLTDEGIKRLKKSFRFTLSLFLIFIYYYL